MDGASAGRREEGVAGAGEDDWRRWLAREPNVEVRSQLACTAKRLPAVERLPIVRGLLAHDEDVADIHLPLLLWWALESKCESDREAVVNLFEDSGDVASCRWYGTYLCTG